MDKDKLKKQFEKDKDYLEKHARKRFFNTKASLAATRKKQNAKRRIAAKKRKDDYLASEEGKQALARIAAADSIAFDLTSKIQNGEK